MVSSLFYLYMKSNPPTQLVSKYTSNNTHYWEGTCPSCRKQTLRIFDNVNTMRCVNLDCMARYTILSFCKEVFGFNREDTVKFILECNNHLNMFHYRQFARIVNPEIFEKPTDFSILSFKAPEDREPAQPCNMCGCTYFLYRITGTNVKPYCLFCGQHQPCLKKIKNSTKNKRDHQATVWSGRVWSRYNGRCALCGSKEGVEAHHIIPWSISEEYRYNENNGILLCQKCHMLAHKKVNTRQP